MATYNSSIEVPADMSLEDAIEYAKEHIDEIDIDTPLEYVGDSDSIDEDNCEFSESDCNDNEDNEIKPITTVDPIATVDELINAIESNDDLEWYVSKYADYSNLKKSYLEFTGSSPAGEDISFSIDFDASKLPCEQIQEIIDDLGSYYECFDTEEHVTMLLEAKNSGLSGVPDVETLVKDAKEIDDMIRQLSEFVDKLPKQDVIFKAVDIDYYIDEDDECDLSDEVEIEPIKFDYAEQYCENNYEGIVDLVSSKTGWCVKSCRVTQVINGNTTTEV
jgi:hypothetical protein